MIERSRMTCHDVMATYGNTILGVRLNEDDEFITPVMIGEAYGDDDGEWCGSIEGSNYLTGREVNLDLFGHDGVCWEWPELGYVNVGEFCVYHRRIASRQWKRGFRREQVETEIVGRNAAHEARRRLHFEFYGATHLKALFNKEYPSAEVALTKINSREAISMAFSQTFAVSLVRGVGEITLVYKGHPVGAVVDGEFILVDTMSHLQPELDRSLSCE